MPTVNLETWIVAPPERCFDLARSVDLHLGSMARTGERAVDGVTEGPMGLGDSVTWEARHLGRSWRLTSRITELDPPHRFVDEQVRGPFAGFRHIHTFVARDGRTLMTDEFTWTAPLGLVGRAADLLFLKRHMRRLLEARNGYLKRVAERDMAANG